MPAAAGSAAPAESSYPSPRAPAPAPSPAFQWRAGEPPDRRPAQSSVLLLERRRYAAQPVQTASSAGLQRRRHRRPTGGEVRGKTLDAGGPDGDQRRETDHALERRFLAPGFEYGGPVRLGDENALRGVHPAVGDRDERGRTQQRINGQLRIVGPIAAPIGCRETRLIVDQDARSI